MMIFSKINYLAVILAGVINFGIGMIWYSPFLFGKMWQKGQGYSESELKKNNMYLAFGGSFVLMTIMALGVALFLAHCLEPGIDWKVGAMHGFFLGILFVGPSIGINNLYGKQSLMLWIIDAGYQITYLTLSGGILGAWK